MKDKTMNQILAFQYKYEDFLNIILNHIFIVYAFFLVISVDGYSRSFLFALMLLLVIIRGNYVFYFSYSIKHPIVIAFFIYAGMHYLWLIGTDNIQWGQRMIDQARVAFYPLIFFSFLDKRFALQILSSFLLGVMISEIISYAIHFKLIPWQFIIHDIVYPWKSHPIDITFYSAYSPLDPSPFLHHSFYAATLALSAVILIYRLISENISKCIKAITIIFILSMTVNLLIIGGRTGYILYFILLSSLMLMIYKKQALKPLIISFSLLSILFTFAYLSNGLFTQRIDQTVTTIKSLYNNPNDFRSSFGSRLGIWYYGLDVISESPLLGTGTGDQMDAVYSKINDHDNFLKQMPDMHNQYFSILLQFGFIGLLVLLNLYYQIFKFDRQDKELNIIKQLILIAMLVTAMTSTYWHFYLPTYLLLISAVTIDRITIKSDIPKPSIKLFSAYTILALISLIMEKLQ